jgi:hypothetical protein
LQGFVRNRRRYLMLLLLQTTAGYRRGEGAPHCQGVLRSLAHCTSFRLQLVPSTCACYT